LQGNEAAEDEAVEAKVTINGQEVEPDWIRRDGTLLATLSPPETEGPWVVRVNVFDTFGELAGREFLEVASSQRRKR
jgi:hypothetical protein